MVRGNKGCENEKQEKKIYSTSSAPFVYDWNLMFMVQNVPKAYIFMGLCLHPQNSLLLKNSPNTTQLCCEDCSGLCYFPEFFWHLMKTQGHYPHSCLNSFPRIILALMLKQKWTLPSHIFPASWPPHHSLLSLIPIDMFSPVRPFRKGK